MRILSNCANRIACLLLALVSMTGGDVALSQERKGQSASNSIRRSVARSKAALVASLGRAPVDDASLAPSQGAPQWRPTSGPEGGVILRLFSSGPNLFAGTLLGGVFRSTNQGERWVAANTGLLPFAIVTSFAASGTNLFAGTFVTGVFRSSDNGESWTAVNTGLPPPLLVSALAVSGTNIFALTDGGVFRSNDQGANWTAVNTGLPPFPPAVPPFLGGSVLAAVGTNLFVGIADLVYRSTNQGESWTQVSAGLPGRDVTALIASGTNLFAGTEDRGVYRSTNQGDNWIEVNTGISDQFILALTAVGTTLFAGTIGSGVFRSTNQGASWTLADAGLPITPNILSLAVSGTTLFAVVEGIGVFRSTNQGASWTGINTGLAFQFVTTLTTSGTNIFAGTPGGGVFYSTNNGERWTAINAGLTNPAVLSLAVSGTSLLAGTLGGGVFITDPFAGLVATVSAASFSGTELAPESIVATFGAGLATTTATATTRPLPTTLAGTSVKVQDALAREIPAPLFYVSPGQLNFQIPPGTMPGAANVIVTRGDGAVSSGTVQIAPVAPGLFAANSNGQGVAAAVALRIKADGTRSFEPVAQFDASQNRSVAIPIDLGPDLGAASDQVFLLLFGTGVRFHSGLSAVTARIGGAPGVDAPVFYAGPQGDFVGLDQLNLPLSRSLAGRGEVVISVTVDGKRANFVSVSIR